MNSNERYEIKAKAFYNMTGLMAPGKDQAAASYGANYDTRQAVWLLWLKAYGEITNIILDATEQTLETTDA